MRQRFRDSFVSSFNIFKANGKTTSDIHCFGSFQYDGVTNYLHTPYFVDLISSGSMVLPDLEIVVPERFVKPEERKHLYVPGSPVATVGIVGMYNIWSSIHVGVQVIS